MTTKTAAITAVGGYVPEHVLTNAALAHMVDTNDEWIVSRTGIKERRILKPASLGTSYMAIAAGRDLIKKNPEHAPCKSYPKAFVAPKLVAT